MPPPFSKGDELRSAFFPVSGLQSPFFGLRSLVSGLRFSVSVFRSPISGLWSPFFGLRSLFFELFAEKHILLYPADPVKGIGRVQGFLPGFGQVDLVVVERQCFIGVVFFVGGGDFEK